VSGKIFTQTREKNGAKIFLTFVAKNFSQHLLQKIFSQHLLQKIFLNICCKKIFSTFVAKIFSQHLLQKNHDFLNRMVRTIVYLYAKEAWHSGHRVRLQNRKSQVRILPGC
jgi:hypothetical protein